MYRKCPECGYERRATDTGPAEVCPACGLIFANWLRQSLRAAHPPSPKRSRNPSPAEFRLTTWLWGRLFAVPERVDAVEFSVRSATYLVFFIWGWQFIWMTFETNDIGASFMHNVNLVFHEAGHIVFMPLGDFMRVLGGTLGQLLMPLVVTLALLLKNRDSFGASLGLWWLGQSLMDCAPYISDASIGQLMLLGGVTGADAPGYHDWENLLGRLGWLRYDHRIAQWVDTSGEALMLLAFVWGGYVLYLQARRLR